MITDMREYDAKKIGPGAVAPNNQPDDVPTYAHTDPLDPEYTWQEKLADARRLLDWYEKEANAGTLAGLTNHGKLMVLRGMLLGEGGYED